MPSKKHKTVPQRNIVAKFARGFNKSSVEQSKKSKQKHKKSKHKSDLVEE